MRVKKCCQRLKVDESYPTKTLIHLSLAVHSHRFSLDRGARNVIVSMEVSVLHLYLLLSSNTGL